FEAVIVEGMEDIELRYNDRGLSWREAFQVKSTTVSLSEARGIIRRFEDLDRESPGTWRSYVIVSRGVDKALQSLESGLRDFRSAGPFYGGARIAEASKGELMASLLQA